MTDNSFLLGINVEFIEKLYQDYLENPSTIDQSWQDFFKNLKEEEIEVLTGHTPVINQSYSLSNTYAKSLKSSSDTINQIYDSLRVFQLIRSYRVRGHLHAHLDPLNLLPFKNFSELEPASYGFLEKDMDRPIFVGGALHFQWASLKDILASLKKFYCGSIGVEYMHIQDTAEKEWIEEKIESYSTLNDANKQKEILNSLNQATLFEKFLQIKFPGAKRFGLEGGESMLPALQVLLTECGQQGVREVVIGMAHRGRLNVLTNILGKAARAILSKFQGSQDAEMQMQGSGDVKYHLGSSSDQEFGGTFMHLSLTSNPSHLEAVDPVVIGKVRAKQKRRGDQNRSEVMGLLIHGDAALAGQGLVAETLDFSDLRGYKTGGTIHFVINNQIGFTTAPHHSRSSAYCTDVGKKIQAPIFHVNGDDPEAVVYVSIIAAQYRARFKRDVFIDMLCYRRHGHNEMDEPSFTQPEMYKEIRNHLSVHQKYAEKLIQTGIISQEKVNENIKNIEQNLQNEFSAASSFKGEKTDWLEGAWSTLESSYDPWTPYITGVDENILKEIGKALVEIPKSFSFHPRLSRFFQARQEMFSSGKGFDWSTAESLAFGSLLCQRSSIRLSGQDSGRGTFSQRHAVLIDQETGDSYIPLNNIRISQEEIEIVDSPLSEAGVLGFEHGYSLADPHSLVLWEAQFGDFANGAQVIIDQFISAGEAKWSRLSGLVMLLPHGYEGQGPEHSSARLERYLQLCAEDNIQVANCSTPANYFHILRRQMVRPTRKPLILMTPKSLLRHPAAVSSIYEMTAETQFIPVYGDVKQTIEDAKIKRVILCSGKIYYDLYEQREAHKIENIAILRLEQFYPFPEIHLKRLLSKYLSAEVVWCQEEPANMGSWNFIDRRLEVVLKSNNGSCLRPIYIGRPASASTATGSNERHKREQALLISQALKISEH